MCDETIINLADRDNDTLVVEESCGKHGQEVFMQTPIQGVFLSVNQVKQLRKSLKKWLIDNGHKEAY